MSTKEVVFSDGGWPEHAEGVYPVTELLTDKLGALSPFGNVDFPVPADELPYIHPVTTINR